MTIISRKSPFWDTLRESASTFFSQGWWMIQKIVMVRTDIFGDVNEDVSCCLSSIWLQIKQSET